MNRSTKLFSALLLTAVYFISGLPASGQDHLLKDYPIQPVSFTKVKVNDHFWAPDSRLLFP